MPDQFQHQISSISIKIMQNSIQFLLNIIQQHGIELQAFNKVVIIPVYAFINKIIVHMKKYVQRTTARDHDFSFAQFLVDSQSEKNKTQKVHALSNLVGSWMKHKTNSLECQLLSSFLKCKDPQRISYFLKFRKHTIDAYSKNASMLDQILLKYEDTINILYKSIKEEQSRKTLNSGVKKLFLSFKIVQAKIYACVFLQYLLTMYQDVKYYNQEFRLNDIISGQTANLSVNNSITKSKSNSKFKTKSKGLDTAENFQSNLHSENGLYRKVKGKNLFNVLQKKFFEKKSDNSSFFGKQISNGKLDQSSIQNQSFQPNISSAKYNEESITSNAQKKFSRNSPNKNRLRASQKPNISDKQKIGYSPPIHNHEKSSKQQKRQIIFQVNNYMTKTIQQSQQQSVFSQEQHNQNGYGSEHKIVNQKLYYHPRNHLNQQVYHFNQTETPYRQNEKATGYSTWLRMIQSNKQFKQKMLYNTNQNRYKQASLTEKNRHSSHIQRNQRNSYVDYANMRNIEQIPGVYQYLNGKNLSHSSRPQAARTNIKLEVSQAPKIIQNSFGQKSSKSTQRQIQKRISILRSSRNKYLQRINQSDQSQIEEQGLASYDQFSHRNPNFAKIN